MWLENPEHEPKLIPIGTMEPGDMFYRSSVLGLVLPSKLPPILSGFVVVWLLNTRELVMTPDDMPVFHVQPTKGLAWSFVEKDEETAYDYRS